MRNNKIVRLLAACLVAASIFIFSAAYNTGDKVDMTLTVEAELLYNNSVGSDWVTSFWVEYNGKEYYCSDGKSVEIRYSLGDSFSLHSYVKESDNYPDVASHTTWGSFSAAEAEDGISGGWAHILTVVEDRGRYAGNSAQWKIKFIFEIEPAPTPRPTPTPYPLKTPHPTPPFTQAPNKNNTPIPLSELPDVDLYSERVATPSPSPVIQISGAEYETSAQRKAAQMVAYYEERGDSTSLGAVAAQNALLEANEQAAYSTPPPSPSPAPVSASSSVGSGSSGRGLVWIYTLAAILVIVIIARVTTFVGATKESYEEWTRLRAENKDVERKIREIVKTLSLEDKKMVLDALIQLFRK